MTVPPAFLDAVVQVTPLMGSRSELAAAWLQAGVTAGLAAICLYIYRKYRKPYFGYWALAWGLYSLRLGAIISFMGTDRAVWLYWHQVATGVTALAFLWAALTLSKQLAWRWRYLAFAAFPVAWSYVAIYRLDNFLMAAGPAVIFLSGATLWTGISLLRHQNRVESVPVRVLGVAFVLWSLHHLDYPFLRARGAWNPWGYYLDIGFELVIGSAILLLVLEEQHRGLRVLSRMAGDLHGSNPSRDVMDLLLRPLDLPGVRGSALFLCGSERRIELAAGAGECEAWVGTTPPGFVTRQVEQVLDLGRPVIRSGSRDGNRGTHAPFSAALPLFEGGEVTGAIVVDGDTRDPFTALDEDFLIALGQQVGAALAQRDLVDRLRIRGRELQDLTARMIEQHEAERSRLSRELHDETAQVLTAVRLQIGRALETAIGPETRLMEEAVDMLGSGIQSVRRVIRDLRPALLDDLGLRSSLAAVAFEFERTAGVTTTFRAPENLPPLADHEELGVFRALQESLANVARHANASEVEIAVGFSRDTLTLRVRDDGVGIPAEALQNGGAGLKGMRDRIEALGGRVDVISEVGRGARLEVTVPFEPTR